MIQFYAPDIATDPVLPESESQHCVKVLRMQMGDDIEVIDGKGHRYACRLLDAHPKHALVEVVGCEDLPLTWQQRITLAIAPTKHLDRMEWLVEKLVEIGVNRIIPVKCQYSERKEIKTERLQKIAVSAMKQSLKGVLPEILPMTPLAEVIAESDERQRFVAYCDPELPRLAFAKEYTPRLDSIVLIGPEGDFSKPEIMSAIDAGYKPVTFGDNRLRTETAALYACTAMHVLDAAN